MKKTCCLGIEPAENGWIVVETMFYEDEQQEADEIEHHSYDPSSAFAGGGDEPRHCLRKEERVHVFVDHKRMIEFVAGKTRTTVPIG